MTTNKKQKREQNFSVEELYQNKNFIPPKEKNLETIFEEPKQAKSGAQILTSVRKYRRYLDFDPTRGKIQKRKLKTKKCFQKFSIKQCRTRSKAKAGAKDINVILEELDDSPDESAKEIIVENNKETAVTEKADEMTDIVVDKCVLMKQTYVTKACQTEHSCILICENCKLLQRNCSCQSSQSCVDTESNVECENCCSGENLHGCHHIKNTILSQCTYSSQFTQTEDSSFTSAQANDGVISPSKNPCIVA